MLKGYYLVDLFLDSVSIILVFYCKLYAFRIILFNTAYFFYPITNKPNIYTITSLAFQASKMSLMTFLAQLVSILRLEL